jgi:DNA-binding CsgD family transcriptional regulator
VTRRTVETHLTHAFQKLDVASRGELDARLATRERPRRTAAAARA